MERNNGQHFNNAWIETDRQLSRGLGNIIRGTIKLAKGGFEVLEGGCRVLDGVALGIGASAVLALGGGVVAPFWAMISKDKNIVGVEKRIAELSSNPKLARAFGYPLLFLAGRYSYFNLVEK